jgi:hypothetical protein
MLSTAGFVGFGGLLSILASAEPKLMLMASASTVTTKTLNVRFIGTPPVGC